MVWDQRDGESSPPPYPPMDRDTLAMVLDPCLWGIIHASTTLERAGGRSRGAIGVVPEVPWQGYGG